LGWYENRFRIARLTACKYETNALKYTILNLFYGSLVIGDDASPLNWYENSFIIAHLTACKPFGCV
jgi:hypothetical protein